MKMKVLFNFIIPTRPMKPEPPRASDDEAHCHCGRLLARWVEGAIELRCQRCKRIVRLELEGRRIRVMESPGAV
jgi:hypothetical protein